MVCFKGEKLSKFDDFCKPITLLFSEKFNFSCLKGEKLSKFDDFGKPYFFVKFLGWKQGKFFLKN